MRRREKEWRLERERMEKRIGGLEMRWKKGLRVELEDKGVGKRGR